MNKINVKKAPTIGVIESGIVLTIILVVLGYTIIGLQQAPQIPLLFVAFCLMIYGRCRHFSWKQIMEGIEDGIKPGITPLFIFLLIGILVATWIFSGTIPTIMYFGFKMISTKFFLPEVFIVCSLVALVCGSSFTTISTIGLVFIAIGTVLKMNMGLVAGAIISGAFFGANVSPISGTTNLAAGIGEINLYQHLKSLLITDLPAWLISLIAYLVIGLSHHQNTIIHFNMMFKALQRGSWISGWTIIPIIIIILLALRQVPSVPTLAIGSFIAVVIGCLHQPTSLKTINNYLINGYYAHTGNNTMDSLLSKGGINSMLSSLALIIFALALGGLLIKFCIIQNLIEEIKRITHSLGGLSLVTAITCLGINVLVGEQYLSIILPGETYKRLFDQYHFPRQYLTRILNDAGSAVNSLIPWSVSGIFITNNLNVRPSFYLPYSFFPIFVFLLTIIIGFILGLNHNNN